MWMNPRTSWGISVFKGLEIQTQEEASIFTPEMGSVSMKEGHWDIVMSNSYKSSDLSLCKTLQARKAKPHFGWRLFLIWSRKQHFPPCGGARAKHAEERGNVQDSWGEVGKEVGGRKSEEESWVNKPKRIHKINSRIIWSIFLESHYTYFSQAPWENKACNFFPDQPGKSKAEAPWTGCGGTSGREERGFATVWSPVSKGLGAQVMHKALTVCPHCLLHKRGWDWEKRDSFQDTGQQPLECPDPHPHPSPCTR